MVLCSQSRGIYLATIVLTLMVTALPAAAQAVIRDGVTYLEAGKVILTFVPDSLDGVHVFAEPRGGRRSTPQNFGARFDPAQITAWLEQAEAVALDAAVPPPENGELLSPVLRGIDGTMDLTVGRLWKSDRRKSAVYWVFREVDQSKPFLIKADAAFSRRLVAALRAAASRSHLDGTAFASGLVEPVGLAVDDSLGPKPLHIPVPRYPSRLQSAGVQGLVEVRYVIDTTGQVDMATFEVLGATHADFIAAAEAALAKGRFRPAQHQGVKVRCRVWQRISFRVGS